MGGCCQARRAMGRPPWSTAPHGAPAGTAARSGHGGAIGRPPWSTAPHAAPAGTPALPRDGGAISRPLRCTSEISPKEVAAPRVPTTGPETPRFSAISRAEARAGKLYGDGQSIL